MATSIQPSQPPAGLNLTLIKAAENSASTKFEIQNFAATHKVRVLTNDELFKPTGSPSDSSLWPAQAASWPKEMGLPLPVPNGLQRAFYGLSEKSIRAFLAEVGVASVKDKNIQVSYDVFGPHDQGEFFVKITNKNEQVAPGAEPTAKWIQISAKEDKRLERPVDTMAPPKTKPKFTEAAPAMVRAAATDPRMGRIKEMVKMVTPLTDAQGAPISEDILWDNVIKASKPDKEGEPSRLDEAAYGIAGAIFSKNGQVNWEKAAPKAEMIKGALLAEAYRRKKDDSLKQIAEKVDAAVGKKYTPIGNANFQTELEALTGAKFVGTEAPTMIGNGENQKAHDARIELIKNAKHDISYAMWKFYGDEAGTRTADALIAAKQKNPDLQVNVVVDGNVLSRDEKSQALVAKMRAAGVQVVPYFDPENPLYGMHGKMIMADTSTEAIAKGYTPVRLASDRNDGDEYLQDVKANDPNNPNFGWSGTDTKFTGSGAAAGMAAFAKVFNTSIDLSRAYAQAKGETPPPFTKIADASIPKTDNPIFTKAAGSDHRVMSLVDLPGKGNNQTISRAMQKLIDGMGPGETISIDQAYFMRVPGIQRALETALARGVNLTIITNSAESCDVPGVSIGTKLIFEQLQNAAKDSAGGKKGTLSLREYQGKQTLHDKMMIFGDKCFMRMSFNQHGRSQTVETEDADVIFGEKATAEAQKNFNEVFAKTKEADGFIASEDERGIAAILGPLANPLM
jgi:phosphatidylserine/phosphatidylglycerophosphate/cardiolipin synthase-like enzyme